MPVPAANHPCWARAANGGLARLKTNHLGTQLMTKRLERSTDPVEKKVEEIMAFFMKWERILPSELEQLARL